MRRTIAALPGNHGSAFRVEGGLLLLPDKMVHEPMFRTPLEVLYLAWGFRSCRIAWVIEKVVHQE